MPVVISRVPGGTITAADINAIAALTNANETAAFAALQRANHTGTQAASTVTGLAAVATSGLKNDVGLSNVDNTADTSKPVSTATATALGLKLDTTVGNSTFVPLAKTVANAIGTKTVTREVADPNRTASKWREVYNTGTFNSEADPQMFWGWNADVAVDGVGDANEPSFFMAFEANYKNTASTRLMEWYIGYNDAGRTIGIFRPIYTYVSKDGTTKQATVVFDLGTGAGGFLSIGATAQVAVFSPTAINLYCATTFGDATRDGTAQINAGGAGRTSALKFSDAGVVTWQLYRNYTDGSLYLRDMANAKGHVSFDAGTTNYLANTSVYSKMTLSGALTVGDIGATTTPGTINLNAGATGENGIYFKRNTATQWILYDASAAGVLYLRDQANAKMHLEYNAGTTNDLAVTRFHSTPQLNGTQDTTATAGANGALPATVQGYFRMKDSAGVTRKVPYFV